MTPATGAATGGLLPLIDRLIAEGPIRGAAAIVVRDGRTVLERYVGEAAPGVPASERTLWPIASISKTFTAAMLLRLVELGELSVQTHVRAVLPSFTVEGREEMRLRHLLTHTSGLRYESPEFEARLRAHTSLASLTDEAMSAPLLFRPGTRFRYSDDAFLIAARMAETVTGRPYATLVEELVIGPMGLRDAHVVPPVELHDRLAYVSGVPAEGSDGAMYDSPYARALGHPAFSVVTSARDLLRFASFFADGGPRIHAEATVRACRVSQTGEVPGEHPISTGYGSDARIPWSYVWSLQTPQVPAILSELASFEAFGHPGASGCHVVVDPVSATSIVVMTNAHGSRDFDTWFRRQQRLLAAAFVEAERR
jgi:CubicO group peptidase (beta-lactamase class C family)